VGGKRRGHAGREEHGTRSGRRSRTVVARDLELRWKEERAGGSERWERLRAKEGSVSRMREVVSRKKA